MHISHRLKKAGKRRASASYQDEDDLIVAEKKRRVLLQLGDLYSRKLKGGVAVACDTETTPNDPFAVSFSLANIWALVGEVCQVPKRFWSDVWRPQERV